MRGSGHSMHVRRVVATLILTGMIAAAAGAEAASLPLTWNAPTTNADGSQLMDLSEYRIYVGTSAPACPGASFHSMSSATTTPTAGQTVSTRIAALTAGSTYFVRVSAVDNSGNESGCSASASGAAQPDVTVTPTGTTSFGSVTVNNTMERTFTVQNTSSASVSVSASVGAPFSIVSGGSGSLAAGTSRTVTVRFSPTTSGSFAGNLNVSAGGDTLSRAVSGSATTAATTTLTVTKSGTGSGTVSSAPSGISCGSDCTQSGTAGTQYTLSATPTSGSTFAGWSGACSGTGTCVTTVNAATTVTATFTAAAPPVTLTVTKTGTGGGTVSSSPAGIACGSDCTEALASGTRVTLTASAASGSVFAGWSGACSGTAATCSWTMSAATAVTAAFNTDRVDPPLDTASPVITSLSPNSRLVKSDGVTLVVAGSGFTNTSTVRWNGTNRATTFVSASQLRTKVTRADLAVVGTIPVNVVTSGPGGGASGSLSFAVGARTPRAERLSPAKMAAGSMGFTLVVKGAWFVPGSVVRWNGADRPTTLVSAHKLLATISAADLTSPGRVAVTVVTPTPGGGTSSTRNFTVTAAGASSPSSSTPPSATASSITVAAPPAASSTLPAAPGNPSVTRRAVDATGVTFEVAWSAAAGATSYRYVAGFGDGSAGQQGTVTGLLTLHLRMPFHASGAAVDGFVCVRSANAAGQFSSDHACAAVPVPAR